MGQFRQIRFLLQIQIAALITFSPIDLHNNIILDKYNHGEYAKNYSSFTDFNFSYCMVCVQRPIRYDELNERLIQYRFR